MKSATNQPTTIEEITLQKVKILIESYPKGLFPLDNAGNPTRETCQSKSYSDLIKHHTLVYYNSNETDIAALENVRALVHLADHYEAGSIDKYARIDDKKLGMHDGALVISLSKDPNKRPGEIVKFWMKKSNMNTCAYEAEALLNLATKWNATREFAAICQQIFGEKSPYNQTQTRPKISLTQALAEAIQERYGDKQNPIAAFREEIRSTIAYLPENPNAASLKNLSRSSYPTFNGAIREVFYHLLQVVLFTKKAAPKAKFVRQYGDNRERIEIVSRYLAPPGKTCNLQDHLFKPGKLGLLPPDAHDVLRKFAYALAIGGYDIQPSNLVVANTDKAVLYNIDMEQAGKSNAFGQTYHNKDHYNGIPLTNNANMDALIDTLLPSGLYKEDHLETMQQNLRKILGNSTEQQLIEAVDSINRTLSEETITNAATRVETQYREIIGEDRERRFDDGIDNHINVLELTNPLHTSLNRSKTWVKRLSPRVKQSEAMTASK